MSFLIDLAWLAFGLAIFPGLPLAMGEWQKHKSRQYYRARGEL